MDIKQFMKNIKDDYGFMTGICERPLCFRHSFDD